MAEPEKEKRIEFHPDVRARIDKRAGGLCSFKGCLASVHGDDGNLDPQGPEFKATSIGEAGHIYAAKKGGPRGQGGQTKEFIASANNGIWVCRDCHGNIDKVDSIYSAETLFEMKLVRETAQRIARHNPQVRFYVSKVGTQVLDDLVWAAEDRNDAAGIADQYISFAEKAVSYFRELKSNLGHSIPAPPISPLQLATRVGRAYQQDPPLCQESYAKTYTRGHVKEILLSDAKQRERAIELGVGWCCDKVNTYILDRVRCEVFTRDPVTGETGAVAKFEVRAGAAYGKHDNGELNLMLKVLEFEHSSVGFSWNMETVVNGNIHRLVKSNFTLKKFACPDNTDYRTNFGPFAAYAALLKEIEQGGKPFIRLSNNNAFRRAMGESPEHQGRMHPDEFPLVLIESNDRIREVIEWNEKALLGFHLTHELKMPIVYRKEPFGSYGADRTNRNLHGFFDPDLTAQVIRAGITQVKGKADKGEWFRGVVWSEPLLEVKRDEANYVIRANYDGYITRFVREPKEYRCGR